MEQVFGKDFETIELQAEPMIEVDDFAEAPRPGGADDPGSGGFSSKTWGRAFSQRLRRPAFISPPGEVVRGRK